MFKVRKIVSEGFTIQWVLPFSNQLMRKDRGATLLEGGHSCKESPGSGQWHLACVLKSDPGRLVSECCFSIPCNEQMVLRKGEVL